MNLGKCLKTIMEAKHVTAYAVAQKTGISQSTLSNIINRGDNSSLETLRIICQGLNIKLSELIIYLDEEDPEKINIIEKYMAAKEFIDLFTELDCEKQTCIMQLLHLLQ